MSEKINFTSLRERCELSSTRGVPTFTVDEIEPLLNVVSERTGQVRKLASAAAGYLDGGYVQYDPWPDRIDELCDRLRARTPHV